MPQHISSTITASRTERVVKVYGSGATAVRALDGIDVGFLSGRFHAIMGASGSGKSTLLHCLAALDEVTSGRIFIGDIEATALDERGRTQLRRDKVGFVFQAYNLVPTLTAEENILLPISLARKRPDEQWMSSLVDMLDLRNRLHHLPSQLSGGEQQRVAAARALTARPEIVFADEPTGNLDSRRSAELLSFMRRAVDDFGQTIVMVTHDPAAASYADRVVFLADGRIVDELQAPRIETVLDYMKHLEG